MQTNIQIAIDLPRSPRVEELESFFHLAPAFRDSFERRVCLPLEEKSWNLGLIVGPSGCGKTTIARQMFGSAMRAGEELPAWPEDRAVIDAFPADMPLGTLARLLSAVGFSAPQSWRRPWRVLSTGERLRAHMVRLLAYAPDITVLDDYSSFLDRPVAHVVSAFLGQTIRELDRRLVVATCHEDVEAWLQPDWVYRPETNLFTRRSLQPRPKAILEVFRCRLEAWQLFGVHDSMRANVLAGHTAFFGVFHGRPVVFTAWKGDESERIQREGSTVTLPDYRGLGFDHALTTIIASLWKGLGYQAIGTSRHPDIQEARRRSGSWRRRESTWRNDSREDVEFDFVGPAMEATRARKLRGKV